LFFSMTFLSIFLDEVGLFRYLAMFLLKHFRSNQRLLFITLYIMVGILTIFTSNDIVILTFTPFICYFCRNAKKWTKVISLYDSKRGAEYDREG